MEVPMAIHESGQMYLETIYILSQNSAFVRAIDVGEQLGFTKPSVSRAMSILKKDGYVNVDADGAITLTETGLAIAKTMYTRHTVLSQMLMELGVDEKTATEDACRIENFQQLFFEFKKYLELQKEYTKLELTEKLTILFSTLIMVLVLIILGMVALFYLLFALAYVLEPLVGGLMASFAIIAGINVLLIALVIIFRKQLIISPMVNFLANLFLTDSNK